MKLDDVKKLKQKKYREQFGCFLVEGEHLILELFKAAKTSQKLQQSELFYTEQYAEWLQAHNPLNLRSTLVSEKAMKQISGTLSPQGIVAAVPFLTFEPNQQSKAVYLHEIQDPGNLGTIIRTLGWFGGFRLFLSPNSVDPYNPKVVRASMGAIFHVSFVSGVSLADVQKTHPRMAYLDMQGEPIKSESFHDFDCYAFGNEARGVPTDELTAANATAFTIPGSSQIESLNLAIAVNLCVYELKR